MKLLTLSGIIFFVGSIIFLKNSLTKLEIARNGEIVIMTIKKLPASCIGTRANHFVSLQYNDIVFDKRTGAGFCDVHYVGERIKMRLLNNNIMFLNEDPVKEILSGALLGMIGIGIAIYGVIKKTSGIRK